MTCCRMADEDERQEENYYLLLHMLVMKAAEVLRAKVTSVYTPVQLAAEIKQNHVQKALQKITSLRKQINQLRQAQIPDLTKFDATFLITLLRNVCLKADVKNPIWDEDDNKKLLPSMQSDVCEIVRIRNVRNTVSQWHQSNENMI